MSPSKPVINDPLDLLDNDKAIFKKKLESAIRDLVKNTSRNECVALVRKHKAPSELEGSSAIKEAYHCSSLTESLSSAIHGGSTLAGKAITAVSGKTLAHALAVGMSKILGHKTLIGIAKTALLTVMGKMAVQKALIALAKTALASIGISLTGGALVKFLLPFVLAFAFYELHEFPRKLGEKIAPTVADAVMGTFRASNKSLLERLYNEKVKSNLKELANVLAGTEHFTEQIMENMVALDTAG